MNKKFIPILFVVLLSLLFLPAFFAGQQASDAQDKRRACLQEARGDDALLAGKLRLGGSGYYLVAHERWHFLMMRCNPSTGRRGCGGASPTQLAMEKHLGEEIRGRLCNGEIAEVEIAGAWYAR